MSIILPSARMGITQPIGALRTPDGRPGIEVVVIDNMVVLHLWRHEKNGAGRMVSEKHYTVELPAASAGAFAELLHQASIKAERIGESPMPKRHKATVLHR